MKIIRYFFFTENEGLKKDFKVNLKNSYKDCEILNFFQDDITKNENNLINEIKVDHYLTKKESYSLVK